MPFLSAFSSADVIVDSYELCAYFPWRHQWTRQSEEDTWSRMAVLVFHCSINAHVNQKRILLFFIWICILSESVQSLKSYEYEISSTYTNQFWFANTRLSRKLRPNTRVRRIFESFSVFLFGVDYFNRINLFFDHTWLFFSTGCFLSNKSVHDDRFFFFSTKK